MNNLWERLNLTRYLDIQLICMSVPTGMRWCPNEGLELPQKRATFEMGLGGFRGLPYYASIFSLTAFGRIKTDA